MIFTVKVCFFLSILSFAFPQDDDGKVEGYKKDTADKRPPRRARPKPVAGSNFAVQAEVKAAPVGIACSNYPEDEPCKCALDPKCDFDELEEKCVSAISKFSEDICRREGSYYAYSSAVICKAPAGECKDKGTSVYAINLNGDSYISSKSELYREEEDNIKVDLEKTSVSTKASCIVTGASTPEDGATIYQTFVEGKPESREEGSCVGYPIPLIQDGSYAFIISTLAEANKCMDIKIAGATVAVDVDLMKLGEEECKAVDIIIQFLVEDAQGQMHIKGHQTPVTIDGGFTAKFCYGGCDEVPDSVYRVSAFNLIRYGSNSRKVEDIATYVMMKGDGTHIFTHVDLEFQKGQKIKSKLETKLNQQKEKDAEKKEQIKKEIEAEVKAKIEQSVKTKVELRKKCSTITDPSQCKYAGCEFNLISKICNSPESICAETKLGKVDCYRASAFYVSGGVICPAVPFETGECDVGEVKFSLNILGSTYQDVNGIDYSAGISDLAKLETATNVEYLDLSTTENVCKKSGSLEFGVGDMIDEQLYSSVVKGKGANAECLSYPISNLEDGSYELSIKTIEPFYEQAGKRAFNVKLNEETILKNFDIANYVGSCQGINIFIQFQISGDILIITGFPQKAGSVKGNTLTLSLCPGDDSGNYADLSFIASAIYVARLKVAVENDHPFDSQNVNTGAKEEIKLAEKLANKQEEQVPDKDSECAECKQFDKNPQKCLEAGFEYNVNSDTCVKRKPDCRAMFHNDPSTCRRLDVMYVEGGVPCPSRNTSGHCDEGINTHGLNLAGGLVVDGKGYTFYPEGNFAVDPDYTKMDYTAEDDGCDKEGSFNEKKNPFGTFIRGKPGSAAGSCVSYPIAVCQNGEYILGIDVMESPNVKDRCFDIRIDDVTIMKGVNNFKLAGRSCFPVELAFPIKVERYGTADSYSIHVRGIDQPIPIKKKFYLKFCTCEWKTENVNYQVSNFDFTRYGVGSMTCDACHSEDGNEAGCVELGCKYDQAKKTCQLANANELAAEHCKLYDDSPNSCKKDGCELNLLTKKCHPGIGMAEGAGICSEAIFADYSNCRRPNAYYLEAGQFCLNKEDTSGNCQAQPTWAVNINGKDFTTRGILFSEEKLFMSNDPNDLRVAVNPSQYCTEEKDEEFKELFATGVQGDGAKKKTGGCINYPVPLCEDGFYELAIFMVDGLYDHPNKRCFDIKLNSLTVAYSVDLVRLGTGRNNNEFKKCMKNEIIILFKVDGGVSQLTPLGSPAKISLNGNLLLQVCFGQCGYADPVFQISGFSVSKFGPNAKTCENCGLYNKNPTSCANEGGCEFNVVTKKCTKVEDQCGQHSEDICKCVDAGCRYDTNSNKCISESEAYLNKLNCRRSRSYYAFSSKTLCKDSSPSEDAKADCKTGSTIYGINAGGRDFEDSEGLKYKREAPGARLDPSDIRKGGNVKGAVELKGVSKEDAKRLYGSYVVGKQNNEGILAYPVVIKQDGEYELILKFIEPIYEEEKKRVFDIKINNIPVVVDIDLVKLAGGVGNPVDISILFFIENSGKNLKIKGASTMIPISSGFHLQFVYGNSKLMIFDTSFVLSGFTIVRFGEDTVVPDVIRHIVYKGGEDTVIANPCEAHGDQMNDCKADGCEFDLENKKCLYQAKDCPDNLFAENSKCQRGGAMYGNSGILCRSKINAGKCTGESILALNLNGPEFNYEERQISFRADKPEDFSDSAGLRTEVSSKEVCKAKKGKLNKNLLMTAVSAKSEVKEGCLDFFVVLKGDGEYEMSVLTFDVHAEANQRCFDVMLNSVTIFANVDPHRISGKACAKSELVLLFKVEGNQVKPAGFSTPIEIQDGKVTLSFCVGKCNSPDTSFRISAFYVFKFQAAVTASADCKDFGKDANACKSSGCEYDLVQEKCISKMQDCEETVFNEFMKCRRKEAFYANGGILCKNQKADCDLPLTTAVEVNQNSLRKIIATNLNGEDYKYRDVQFQTDLGDSDHGSSLNCRGGADAKLFKTVASSSDRASAAGCMSYSIPIPEDGQYELTIWTVDSETEVNKKCWDIELDHTTVVYAIDPARLSGGVSCKNNEIIILFKVQDSASQLIPLGFASPILIKGKKVDLNFCKGSCSYAQDKNFDVSAFSLMKLQPKVSKELVLERSSIQIPDGADPCTVHGKDAIACHAAACEFSLETNQCVHRIKQCRDDLFLWFIHCRRGDSFYADGGVLCKNYPDQGECDYRNDIVLSLNLGGKVSYIYRSTQRMEIFMHLERSWDYDESEGKRIAIDNHANCPNLLKSRHTYHYEFLATAVTTVGGCLTYMVPLKGDGVYEIVLSLVDGIHSGPNQRGFDIMLNQKTVLFALDIVGLAGNCKNTELVILIDVQAAGTKLFPRGFTEPIAISGGKVDLKFCTGSTGYQDQSPLVSGIYVMKLREAWGDDPCTIHGNDKIACHKAKCEFSLVKNQCVHRIKACTDEDFMNHCRRSGIYYQNGGVLCRYLGGSSQNCNFNNDVTIALNLGGRELYTFHDGDGRSYIHFRLEQPGDFDEKEGQRDMVESGLVCPVWKGHYQTYYNNFLVTSVGSARGGCLTYYLPLKGDGIYEASIWTTEGQYRGPNQRCFDIKIFDKVVIFALDVAMYRGTCNVMEIMIQFKVEEGQTRLTVKGFPDSITITNGKVDLKLCSGSCGAYDQTATASGIYLMKIG